MLSPRRLVSIHTAVLVLALSVPASARPTPATVHIDNFGQISPTYYRGGQPKGADYAALASLGVKTLVNLTGDDADPREGALARGAGMSYFQIPMTTRQVPTPAQIAQFLKIVNDPANQPVYVHCVGGRHRTGVMTAIYRLTHDAWTPERAFGEMKQFRFGADFLHPEFKAFVFSYAGELKQAAAAAGTRPAASSR